ncbi:MAG: hypothetical protein QOG94_1104 [Solirubrobacteraceae bacterium]|nr:hypothetical protein [Solirubrobacteraceae bacterium]
MAGDAGGGAELAPSSRRVRRIVRRDAVAAGAGATPVAAVGSAGESWTGLPTGSGIDEARAAGAGAPVVLGVGVARALGAGVTGVVAAGAVGAGAPGSRAGVGIVRRASARSRDFGAPAPNAEWCTVTVASVSTGGGAASVAVGRVGGSGAPGAGVSEVAVVDVGAVEAGAPGSPVARGVVRRASARSRDFGAPAPDAVRCDGSPAPVSTRDEAAVEVAASGSGKPGAGVAGVAVVVAGGGAGAPGSLAAPGVVRRARARSRDLGATALCADRCDVMPFPVSEAGRDAVAVAAGGTGALGAGVVVVAAGAVGAGAPGSAGAVAAIDRAVGRAAAAAGAGGVASRKRSSRASLVAAGAAASPAGIDAAVGATAPPSAAGPAGTGAP